MDNGHLHQLHCTQIYAANLNNFKSHCWICQGASVYGQTVHDTRSHLAQPELEPSGLVTFVTFLQRAAE